MSVSVTTKEQLKAAIRRYGPKHWFLRWLVVYRSLGYTLLLSMLLIYTVTGVFLALMPEPLTIQSASNTNKPTLVDNSRYE